MRGEPSVAGDRRPLGVAREGNGTPDRVVVETTGVPATCSKSALSSRGTAEGRRAGWSSVAHCLLIPNPTPDGADVETSAGTSTSKDGGSVSIAASLDVRGMSLSAVMIVTWTLCSLVSGRA